MSRRLHLLPVYVLIVVLVVASAGCATTSKKHPGVGMGGVHLSSLTRSQYVIMDTVEGTGKCTTLFWVFQFPLGKKLGYTEYASGQEGPGAFSAIGNMGSRSKAKAMALYDALGQVPNADAVLPMSATIESTGIPFFIKEHTATIKGKGIKIKADGELSP